MVRTITGTPCWYELATSDLDGAAQFYQSLLGWSVDSADMPGFDYRLARQGGAMVAGIMAATSGTPPGWAFYVTVQDCDAVAKSAAAAGGRIYQQPTDIPGTGRFAMLGDPQGAAFGVLQMLDDDGAAFNPQKPGHGSWHELMTSDPTGAMAFYGDTFGWQPSTSMDMGPIGSYDLFGHRGTDIGGMMKQAPGMPGPDHPFWLPYFAVKSVDAAIARTKEAGGTTLHGPREVPGGLFIMLGKDPQGALFALSGPK
jgi:uncharacterized protein